MNDRAVQLPNTTTTRAFLEDLDRQILLSKSGASLASAAFRRGQGAYLASVVTAPNPAPTQMTFRGFSRGLHRTYTVELTIVFFDRHVV